MITWHQELKMALVASGRTQGDVAKACVISRVRMSRLLRGSACMRHREALALGAELNVDPAVLLGTAKTRTNAVDETLKRIALNAGRAYFAARNEAQAGAR